LASSTFSCSTVDRRGDSALRLDVALRREPDLSKIAWIAGNASALPSFTAIRR
jgi:hypothetical protein